PSRRRRRRVDLGGGRAHGRNRRREARGRPRDLPAAGIEHDRDGGPGVRAPAELRASIPPAIKLAVALDRTTSIRAAFHDVQISLGIAVVLVVLVVFVFLRSVSATLIPSVAVPLSLVGTFGGMYLFGYSLDNLSLMALTISTGFVVDDAIVVLENIT